ncbi:hypothetical protein HAX54_029715 [Datura stramonium]|uniref:Uncharacterized protein n=1 Tax=Datura stramonium TaxID=4076 RepID=A0ABS8RLI3_DATST|nr:hypothetical protein [Datura stramonium]
MFSSEPISREMDKWNSFLFSGGGGGGGSSSFRNGEGIEPEFLRSKEIAGSEFFHQQSQFQQSNALTRYRPLQARFSGILDGGNSSGKNFVTHDGSSSSDSDSMFTALLNNDATTNNIHSNNSGTISGSRDLNDQISNQNQKNQLQFAPSMKQEIAEEIEFGNENGVQNRYENDGISYGVGVQMQTRGSLSNGNGGSNLTVTEQFIS